MSSKVGLLFTRHLINPPKIKYFLNLYKSLKKILQVLILLLFKFMPNFLLNFIHAFVMTHFLEVPSVNGNDFFGFLLRFFKYILYNNFLLSYK